MRVLVRAMMLCLACLVSPAQAFDFVISDFKVIRNNQTIFDDTFAATIPPAAPNFRSGTAATYSVPAGSFSSAGSGRLNLNSAAATISPAVSTKLAVAAQLNTSKDATDPTSGLKPGSTFEVHGNWDAVAPDGSGELYFIEIGDWDNKTCECIRLGVVKQSDGSVIIRFWRDTIGNDAIQSKTVLGAVAFNPGSNAQILLKLKKSSATSNAVTASYAYVNGGVAGAETSLAGTTDAFAGRAYAVAAFKASAPVAYAKPTGTNKALSMTSKINVANSHSGKTGNIYVAAVFQGMVFMNNGTTWVQYSGGAFTPYASNVTLGDRSINILSGLDVSGLVGAQILVGYGTSDTDLINSSAFETIYTVQ